MFNMMMRNSWFVVACDRLENTVMANLLLESGELAPICRSISSIQARAAEYNKTSRHDQHVRGQAIHGFGLMSA
jgi:hypothetical protein